jgi:hypothetical protein
MVRRFVSVLCAVFALALLAGGLRAEEYMGKIKKVDADKGLLTVTVKGEDKDFTVSDAKLLGPAGKELKNGVKNKAVKEGANVTVTTEKKGGKEVVTQVQLGKKKASNK